MAKSKMSEVLNELFKHEVLSDMELRRLIFSISGVTTGRSLNDYKAYLIQMGFIKFEDGNWLVSTTGEYKK